MRFEKRGCPCVAECPNRSAYCRATCEPFLAYEAKRVKHKVNQKLYSGDITVGKAERMEGNIKYKKMRAQGRI